MILDPDWDSSLDKKFLGFDLTLQAGAASLPITITRGTLLACVMCSKYNCQHLKVMIESQQVLNYFIVEAIGRSEFRQEQSGEAAIVLPIRATKTDTYQRFIFRTVENHSAVEIMLESKHHDGSNNSRFESIGLITPEYESFATVLEICEEFYAGAEASLTQCTSSSHWKTKSKTVTYEDKVCLDLDGICHACAKRTYEAMKQTDSPETGGFLNSGKPGMSSSSPDETFLDMMKGPHGELAFSSKTAEDTFESPEDEKTWRTFSKEALGIEVGAI